jgi:hypothetical protein
MVRGRKGSYALFMHSTSIRVYIQIFQWAMDVPTLWTAAKMAFAASSASNSEARTSGSVGLDDELRPDVSDGIVVDVVVDATCVSLVLLLLVRPWAFAPCREYVPA